VNLDAYFERIGWSGPRAPTLEVLGGILDQHMLAIPFENLDVLLGDRPRLDVGSLERKLVDAKRGGYCYEHATLFAAVLSELGFTVKTHSARVVMATPRSAAPRTHMFLTVGELMLDPGFGGGAPRLPVPLDGTPAGEHRLVREGSEYTLEQAGKCLWMSSFEHDIPIDFEMANHFTATHPASHFTQTLMMRALTPDGGQVRIRNREVTLTRGDETQTYQLADRAQLRAAVGQHFGFDLPALETIHVPAVPEWR
jgi:N-hydroxyarylamine O-acetyltransferase